MSAVPIFVLLAVGCCLLCGYGLRWKQAARQVAGRRPDLGKGGRDGPALPPVRLRQSPRRDVAGAEEEDMVRLVRQLSALLVAGRSGSQLWADAARARAGPVPPYGHLPQQQSTGKAFILSQLSAAQRAAEMGLSPGGAIRSGCVDAESAGVHHLGFAAWQGLAACLDVARTSGAPLAEVLMRFAAQLEGAIDATAMRETALAGPKATVRLLTWLPVFGLGLGMLMGVDPLSVLLGGPLGWSLLFTGTGLMTVGRYWSRASISAAAGTGP